ncbi:SWIM zinc finger family protein [Magnetospirillum sulfuroxidans]
MPTTCATAQEFRSCSCPFFQVVGGGCRPVHRSAAKGVPA